MLDIVIKRSPKCVGCASFPYSLCPPCARLNEDQWLRARLEKRMLCKSTIQGSIPCVASIT